MRLKLIVLLSLSLSLFSCSDKNEPINESPAPLKIVSIKCDKSSEVYEYDSQGRVIAWTGSYGYRPAYNDYDDIRIVSYHYSQPLQIDLSAQEKYDYINNFFTESLFLNEQGYVTHTEGIWEHYEKEELYLKKIYQRFFTYDDEEHLISIKFSEWQESIWPETPGRYGYCEENPWTWEDTLEWEDGNLVKYINCQGKPRPVSSTLLTYEKNNSIGSSVIPVFFNFLNFWYYPLQVQECFGKNPLNLPDELVYVRHGSKSDDITGKRSFQYEFDLNSNSPRIIGFKSSYYPSDSEYVSSYDYSVEWTE